MRSIPNNGRPETPPTANPRDPVMALLVCSSILTLTFGMCTVPLLCYKVDVSSVCSVSNLVSLGLLGDFLGGVLGTSLSFSVLLIMLASLRFQSLELREAQRDADRRGRECQLMVIRDELRFCIASITGVLSEVHLLPELASDAVPFFARHVGHLSAVSAHVEVACALSARLQQLADPKGETLPRQVLGSQVNLLLNRSTELLFPEGRGLDNQPSAADLAALLKSNRSASVAYAMLVNVSKRLSDLDPELSERSSSEKSVRE